MQSLKAIIERLDLQPHPEGGYYKETYRSAGCISPENLNDNYQGSRNYATCIYFLLTSSEFSALHKIHQDEIWHFYAGSPIRLHVISESGVYTKYIIGNAIEKGETPQLVVPGGHWFGAEVMDTDSYALVGCTVAPGFDFDDFFLGSKDELTTRFPHLESVIMQLTRQ